MLVLDSTRYAARKSTIYGFQFLLLLCNSIRSRSRHVLAVLYCAASRVERLNFEVFICLNWKIFSKAIVWSDLTTVEVFFNSSPNCWISSSEWNIQLTGGWEGLVLTLVLLQAHHHIVFWDFSKCKWCSLTPRPAAAPSDNAFSRMTILYFLVSLHFFFECIWLTSYHVFRPRLRSSTFRITIEWQRTLVPTNCIQVQLREFRYFQYCHIFPSCQNTRVDEGIGIHHTPE